MTKNELKREKTRATRDLQEMLLELNRGGIINTKVIPDGIFGNETTAAVLEFQRIYGLEPNGVVDRATWDLISSKHTEARNQRRRAEAVRFFPEEKGELKLGDIDDAVFILQLVFRALAREFDEFNGDDINGVFDNITENNVKAFQRLGGFEEHGRVDKPTWNRIARYYNLFEN